MRVAFLTLEPMPKIGGEWTVISQLMEGLKRRGHSVVLASQTQMRSSWLTMANRSSQLVRIIFRGWLWFFFRMTIMGVLVRWLVSGFRLWDTVDIIDAQGPIAFLAINRRAQRRKRPVVLTIHGYFQHESNMGSIRPNSFWGILLQRIEERAFRRAPAILTVDSNLKEYVVRLGALPERVHVRRNFVDPTSFTIAPPSVRAAERKRLGLGDNTRAICCARRLEEKCGVRYAIEATAKLVERGLDATLLIAGTGSLEKALRSAGKRLGIENRVRFLGFVDRHDMPKLLSVADAVVVPSITVGEEVEATSLSALEAMSCGIPVVASRIGGLKEIILDGVDGILVPERDVDALTGGLIRALGMEGRHLGEEARKSVCSRFSIDKGVEATMTLYRSLMAIGSQR